MEAAEELGCEFQSADVCKRGDWQALLQTAIDKFGSLDVVVNNAGATYSNKVCLPNLVASVPRARRVKRANKDLVMRA